MANVTHDYSEDEFVAEPYEATLRQALNGYPKLWFTSALGTIFAIIGAHYVFGIDLSSVADVLLSVQVFTIAVTELLFLFSFAMAIPLGFLNKNWSYARGVFLLMVLYTLLIFAPILVFSALSLFTNFSLPGHSFVYDLIAKTIDGIFHFPALALSYVLTQVNQSDNDYGQVANFALDAAAKVASVLSAIYVMLGMRAKAAFS